MPILRSICISTMPTCFSCFPAFSRPVPSRTETKSHESSAGSKPLNAQSFLVSPKSAKQRTALSRSSFSFGTPSGGSRKSTKRQSLHADLSARRSLWDEIGLGVGNIDYQSSSSLLVESNVKAAGEESWLNEDWAQRIIEATSSSGTASGSSSLTSSRSSDRDMTSGSPSIQSRGLYEDLVLTSVNDDKLVRCDYERPSAKEEPRSRVIV